MLGCGGKFKVHWVGLVTLRQRPEGGDRVSQEDTWERKGPTGSLPAYCVVRRLAQVSQRNLAARWAHSCCAEHRLTGQEEWRPGGGHGQGGS